MTAEYNEMSEAQRKSATGTDLQKNIAETTAKLKEEEQEPGNFRRSVGDYAQAGASLKKEMKEIIDSLAGMRLAGEQNSEQYKEMTARLTELRDASQGTGQGLTQLQQGITALTGAYGTYAAALGFSSETEKEYEEVMKRM